MTTVPGLFEGTAPYYSKYRFGYPEALFDFLVDRFKLSESSTVLDLGCGTGQIALPLARRRLPVRAVDPDISMLAEGLRVEAAQGLIGVAWQRGDDEHLSELLLSQLAMCIMGASFHWTKRDQLLDQLDRLIAPGGGVVVVDGGRGEWKGLGKDWNEIVQEVVRDFLGPERRAGGGVYRHPEDRHETVLARSKFRNVERRNWKMAKTLTIDDIIGFQLSTSYASPAQLGVRLVEFRDALKNRLNAVMPDGLVEGELSFDVLVATRPSTVSGSSAKESK